MRDDETGLSIRFIREYKPERHSFDINIHDIAIQLAMFPVDEDDARSFRERLTDAYAYIREQQRKRH